MQKLVAMKHRQNNLVCPQLYYLCYMYLNYYRNELAGNNKTKAYNHFSSTINNQKAEKIKINKKSPQLM